MDLPSCLLRLYFLVLLIFKFILNEFWQVKVIDGTILFSKYLPKSELIMSHTYRFENFKPLDE